MNLLRHRAVISVAVTLGLILGLLAAAGWYVLSWHDAAEARIEEIEPRHARLLGLKNADAPLRKAVLDAYGQLRHWSYAPDQDVVKAGNDVQQRARRAAEAGGMSIVSSQVLPPRTEGKLELVTVTLTLEGTLTALQSTIVAMEKDSPVLFVESLSMRMAERGDPKAPQQVSAVLGLAAIRSGL